MIDKEVAIVCNNNYIYRKECKELKITQEINPIGSEIPIGTIEIKLKLLRDWSTIFKEGEEIVVYFYGSEIVTARIISFRFVNEDLVLYCEDNVSILENTSFSGDVYSETPIISVLTTLFSVANVPWEIDESLLDKTISGNINLTTCRDALLQICFAVGAYVKCMNGTIYICANKKIAAKKITSSRILQDVNFEKSPYVSKIIIEEIGKPIYDSSDTILFSHYSTKGEIYEQFFPKAYARFDLEIEGGSISTTDYDILEQSARFIKIKFNMTSKKPFVYTGREIVDYARTIKAKENPLPQQGSEKKEIIINTATLVNQYNSEAVLNTVFSFLTSPQKISCKIVEGKHVQEGDFYKYGEAKYGAIKYGERKPSIITYDEPVHVGDTVEVDLGKLGVQTKLVKKQTYTLNSSIIVKECTLQ